MDVLPALCHLSFEGLRSSRPMRKVIKPFIYSRQLSGCPISVECWEREGSPSSLIDSVSEFEPESDFQSEFDSDPRPWHEDFDDFR
jgi:hypothetical protein